MNRKVMSTAVAAAVIVSMAGAIPAMAATQKPRVVLPKKVVGTQYNFNNKTWQTFNSRNVVYDRGKGVMTKIHFDFYENGKKTEDIDTKFLYDAKGRFQGTKEYENGKKRKKSLQETFKWKKAGTQLIKHTTWEEDETGDTEKMKEIFIYDKDGKILTSTKYRADGSISQEHTVTYYKKGKKKNKIKKDKNVYYDTDKKVSQKFTETFTYNKQGQLTKTSYKGKSDYGTYTATRKYTYKKGKMVKYVYEWEDNYKDDVSDSGKETYNYKYKKNKITRTEYDRNGKKTSVTIFNQKIKDPGGNPDFPYMAVKDTTYDPATGKKTDQKTYSYTFYTKGKYKGYVKTQTEEGTWTEEDDDGSILTEPYLRKYQLTYTTCPLSEYDLRMMQRFTSLEMITSMTQTDVNYRDSVMD